MRFYGREKELSRINDYKALSEDKNSKMLVVTGRRRIGKTRLIIEAAKNSRYIYFFVARKKIDELLREWSELIRQQLGNVFLGNISTLNDLLRFLFQYSQTNRLTVIFDEFQNFHYFDKAAYSVFQKHFDLEKSNTSLLIILSGSSHTLMEKIFKDHKEPLFGRASDIMNLSYLTLKSQIEFLKDENLSTALDKIFLFSVFDGVPKYWESINETKGKSFKARLQNILENQDWIWTEGEMLLKEEFGKDYATYYSILSAISKGRRSLSEIDQFAGIKDATIYLQRLSAIYNLIEKRVPVTDLKRSKTRKNRWYIKDNFLKFWFGIIEPEKYLKEIGLVSTAAENVIAKLHKFSGFQLEKLVIRKIIEENPLNIQFTRIGNYWDRKGEVEIDVIIVNEPQKKAYFFEVKLDKMKLSKKVINRLYENAQKIPEYENFQKYYYSVYPAGNEITFEQIKS